MSEASPQLPANESETGIVEALAEFRFEFENVAQVEDFNYLKVRPRRQAPAGILPLRIGLWNCRGLQTKEQEIWDLLATSSADILVLNETFRPSRTPWPTRWPPCMAEATKEQVIAPGQNPRRNPNGVAIIVQPDSLKPDGCVQSFDVLDVDNVAGTKVVVRINDLVIFAVYCPPNREGFDLLLRYASEAAALAIDHDVVFCGDLNVVIPDDEDEDGPPARIAEFLLRLGPGFSHANTGPDATRPARRLDAVNTAGNTLDHFFVSGASLASSRVLTEFAGFSDHLPIVAAVSPRPAASPSTLTKYWRLRTEKLLIPEVKEAYKAAIEAGIPGLIEELGPRACETLAGNKTQRLDGVNWLEKRFVAFIMDTATEVLGRKRVPLLPLPIKPASPSQEYLDAKAALEAKAQEVLQLLHVSPDSPRLAWSLAEQTELRQQLTRIQVTENQRGYREFYSMLADLPPVNRMKLLNRIRRRHAAAGQSLATSPDALDTYRAHFAQQFTNSLGIAQEPPVPILDFHSSLATATELFDESVILDCLVRSPTGKAPGMTGLCVELLQPVSDAIVPILHLLFTCYFTCQVVPSSWTRALICPVPKKGDLSRINNYRPISLTEVSRKLYETCLLVHLTEVVPISMEQGGFRARRGCYDQVEALQHLTQSIRTSKPGRRPHLAFLDIKAAYDSVPRGELWRRLAAMGLNPSIMATLRALFDHNSAQLALAGRRSQPFALEAGVLQGSVLSPLLYSVFIDPLAYKLRDGPALPLPRNDEQINCLLYADDVVLMAKSRRELAKLLAIAEADSIARGYRFSPSKCAVIGFGRCHQLYGNPIPYTDSFCYLGIDFDACGIDQVAHATRRAAKARAVTTALKKAGARSMNLPARGLISLYKSIIRPALEYGLPLLSNAASIQALEKAQRGILKELLGLPPHASTDLVSAVTNCPPIPIRRQLLLHSRDKRLYNRWYWSEDRDALIVVKSGLYGEHFVPSTPLSVQADKVYARCTLFTDPLELRLRDRFDKELNLKILRKLVRLKLAPGYLRLLLLWIVDSWRPWKTRFCLKCRSHDTSLGHVIECTGLQNALDRDFLLPFPPAHDPPVPRTSRLVVEERIRAIATKRQPNALAGVQLVALCQHMCHSLEAVFGPLNRDTYN